MKNPIRVLISSVLFFLCAFPQVISAQHLMENLGRGVVAVRSSTTKVFISWRVLGTDPAGTSFNLYRKTNGGSPVLLNASPITGATCYEDTAASTTQSNEYFVRPIIYGNEEVPSGSFTLSASAPVQPYLRVPLQIPAPMTMPDGSSCTYSANDCSVGDLDGDGEYEIIVKWDPSNSRDNSQSGYTGNVFLDAYKLDGTRLWRIDLGKNIRAGAHYTQLQVYDLDGDGIAEIACKTADGTIDGVGTVIGDSSKDWRNTSGYILTGPEFLTIFNGRTGAALTTVNYVPARGTVTSWGDNYGNRVDRFLAGIAYLDGQRPSLVTCRGYYTRAVLTAWDWRNGQLTQRWVFDSDDGTPGNTSYRGQGNHNLTVADVDGDGKDEIVYGSATIDDNGKGLYTTRLGHGDAMHVSQMDPAKPDLYVWVAHEDINGNGNLGHTLREAKTGKVIFSAPSSDDAGRAMSGDIDPNYPGYEVWGARCNLTNAVTLQQISTTKPSMNFAVWWDGDLLRELLDGTTISKWNWTTKKIDVVLSPSGLASNNSTKSTPCLSGDILGDWREEVVWREADSSALRIYTTTTPTTYRITTLMHDRQYREAIAWQNTAYNQPPHPSFFLGHNMSPPPTPNIVTSLDVLLGPPAPVITSISNDSGVSATDFITSDKTLIFHGTASPNMTIKVTLDGTGIIGTTTANASGNWDVDCTATTLPEGKSRFTATATDAQSHTGVPSLPCVVTIITTSPPAPVISSITGGASSYVFTGTAQPGTFVTVSNATLGALGTAETDDTGVWTFSCPLSAIPTGSYSFTAKTADAAGNISVTSPAVSINTAITTPTITGIATDTGSSAADGVTSAKLVVIRGTAAATDTVTVSIIGSGATVNTATAAANGTWSIACAAPGLTDGMYAFTALASNGSGTSAAAPAFVVTVDTAAPVVASIVRPTPGTPSAVTFRATFSEDVTGVTAASFTLTLTGGLTGAITNLAAVDAAHFDVTVGNLNGDGTVRLDVIAATSGITDIAGNALAANFTTGQIANHIRTGDGTWINNATGGLWSDYNNWLDGTRGEGVGKTADFTTVDPLDDINVVVDAPFTIGNITFGDADPMSATNWNIIAPATGVPNPLTLSVASGAPTIAVDGLGDSAQASISVPLAGTQGLSKSGTNTLVLTGANTLTGAVTVSTGSMILGNGGVLNLGSSSVTFAGTSRFSIAGGTFATEGTVSAGGGKNDSAGMFIQSGSVRMDNFRTNSDMGGFLIITGGTVSIGSVSIQRNAGTSPDFATGFVVRGGSVEIGKIGVGTSNSYGSMSIEGGSVLVTDTFTLGNQQTGGRGGALRMTGGSLVSTNTTDGLILGRTNGTNLNNVATGTFSGGVATFEKITLGYDNTVTSGSSTITVNGGALYIGSGGIVKKGTSGLVSAITLATGTLGAKAAWTTAEATALTSSIVIRTADALNNPFDITLTGAISGTGGFTKNGAGALTLSGTNTFTGAAALNEGTLAVTGTHSKFTSLAWNTGATLQLDVARGDRLVVSGALTKTGAGKMLLMLKDIGPLTVGTTHVLAAFGSTTLTTADFATNNLAAELDGITTISGVTPTINVTGSTLTLTLVASGPPAAPVFTSPTTATGKTGADFSYEITVNNTASTYAATSLPAGLTFNTTTGVISGRPTASGTFNVTLSATNSKGTTNSTLVINIAAIPTHTALVTLAGIAQSSGTTNGQTTSARFKSPSALVAHTNGNLYIADTDNNAIRVIDPQGNVTTLAKTGVALALPSALITGTNNTTLLVADTGNNTIRSLNLTNAQFTTIATGITQPEGLARDTAGNLYIASASRHVILKLTPGATTATTLAGTLDVSGTGQLNTPTALAIGPDGKLYVADTLNHAIRKIDPASGAITTFAGQPGFSGTATGPALDARFNKPEGIAFDTAGNLYIANTGNHTIALLDAITNEVSTLVGLAGAAGSADGLSPTARLNTPTGLAIDNVTGDIYVADTGNHTIRVLLSGPRILKHPENQTVTTGSSAQFTVLAIGAPNPTYQWKQSGTSITSATNYTHTISNAQQSHAGSYTVVVTNEMGTLTSNAATLTVTATTTGTTTPPPPPPSGGGNGGGGGAQSHWYFIAIPLLALLRRVTQKWRDDK